MRVLVFGASITQGFFDSEGGWVARLRKHYDQIKVSDMTKDPPTIFNLAISGDTTKNVLKRFNNETEARIWPGEELSFIFSIGTNNTTIRDGKNEFEPEDYRKDIENLINQAEKYSNRIMFVGLPSCGEEKTTPVSWVNIHYTNERIYLFDEIAREVCARQKITHIPIFEIFQQKTIAGQNLFADGLHPNDEGHKLIFELVQPQLDELLNT